MLSPNQVRLSELDPRIGTVIGVLALEPHELSDRFHLTFEESEDDLDQLVAAGLRVGDRQYALVRHKHHPAPGTEILTSCDSTSYAEDLREVLQQLHLPESSLTWTHPSIDESRPAVSGYVTGSPTRKKRDSGQVTKGQTMDAYGNGWSVKIAGKKAGKGAYRSGDKGKGDKAKTS